MFYAHQIWILNFQYGCLMSVSWMWSMEFVWQAERLGEQNNQEMNGVTAATTKKNETKRREGTAKEFKKTEWLLESESQSANSPTILTNSHRIRQFNSRSPTTNKHDLCPDCGPISKVNGNLANIVHLVFFRCVVATFLDGYFCPFCWKIGR